ncbi:MAG: efflux RND transporter permease subunit, partial [Pyramidobacter sp.]|nr:efflux RND transporter permease subunit [Pyramidobacter sp.]
AKRLRELEVHRPIGMELEEIYMQSDQVTKAINDFIVNLMESLAIVVGVLLVFMGLRTGLLIGVVLLLTVAGTIALMNACGIFLQLVSLAALIIALGSLVDNAIVVSEGMLVGVERGQPIADAADESVEGAKWAMLGGTFIAVLAFVPIGFSQAQAGEYCRSIYQVVGLSMMFSWLMALTATPVLGTLMLKPGKAEVVPYNQPLFRAYRWLLEACLRHRVLTMSVTAAVFAASVWGYTRLEQSFFPDANTAYYTVDLWGTEGKSLEATRASAVDIESYLRAMPEVKNVTDFIGGGSLRFMLTYSPPDPNSSFAQLLVETKDHRDMRSVLLKTQKYIDESMPGVDGICKPFSKGSGMTPRIEARFYGEDSATLRELGAKAKAIFEADPSHKFARLDWRTPVEVIRPRVMKDQMRNLGLTRPMINQNILVATTGLTIGAYRDGDKTLPILAVVEPAERNRMDRLKSFPIWAPAANASVPMGTVISALDVGFEDNLVMRRDRSRVLTVATDTLLGSNADSMLRRVRPQIEAIPLPVGYSLAWGGEQELSGESLDSMKVAFIPALVLMFTIMVFLFNGLRQPLIIFVLLPLILIGVVAGLALARMSVSFLAIVGMLSLIGMLAKNSIVLLDQVSADF